MTSHVMVDLETAGNSSNAAIISVGLVKFNFHSNKMDIHKFGVNLQSCIRLGMQIEPDTFLWWLKQNDKARETLIEDSDTGNSILLVLDAISRVIGKNDIVWAKSPRFDLGILHTAYKLAGKEIPWNFRNERDVRTITSLSNMKIDVITGHVPHDPISDCIQQIHEIKTILNHLNLNYES